MAQKPFAMKVLAAAAEKACFLLSFVWLLATPYGKGVEYEVKVDLDQELQHL